MTTTYVMHPAKTMIGRRVVSGYTVCAVKRIGQRYVEIMGDGYWAPRGLFEVQELGWHKSADAASRAIKKLIKANPEELRLGDPFGPLTFTGSCGGPGFWPLKESNGPVFAMVDLSKTASADDPLNGAIAKL